MFTQGSKPPDTEAQTEPTDAGPRGGEPSVISADLKVVGDLHCAGDIQIKGTVEGDVKSRSVTVGEGAHVQGSIYGDSVHVSGSVKGYIEAPAVTVAKSAKILGDIVHDSLAVEAGAFLEGQCRRLDTKKADEKSGLSALKTGAPGEAGVAVKRAAGGS